MKNWKVNSWRKFPVKHIPAYDDDKELNTVLNKLKTFPPLVFAGETRHLKEQLAKVVDGKAFLLQGGDCAESFAEFHPDNIRDTFKVILQMSLILTYSASLPVVKLGRIAGQFSKPRSAPTEKQGDKELPSYLGDNINAIDFNEKARRPDPKRMFKAYSQSASTLNLLRAFSKGGFADLNKVHLWNLDYIKKSPQAKKFKDLEDKIADALAFMEACGITSDFNNRLYTVNFWTSHEALHLPFEESMTRVDSTTGEYHDTSAHFVWIGDRTRQLDGGHVEFCKGIENPIGIKCGPTSKPDEIAKICEVLNPKNEKGKITLISRFGYKNVEKYIPGYYTNTGSYRSGRVRKTRKQVPCNGGGYATQHAPQYQQQQGTCTRNENIFHGLLGGGIAAMVSKKDAYIWSIPLGVVSGVAVSKMDC